MSVSGFSGVGNGQTKEVRRINGEGTGCVGPRCAVYLMRGLSGQGYLIIEGEDSRRVRIKVTPAHLKLIYILWKVYQAEAAEDAAIRGWRSASRIGRLYGRLGKDSLPISGGTVIHYVAALNDRVSKAGGVREFIERARGIGYRIGVADLTVVDRAGSSHCFDGAQQKPLDSHA